MVLCEDDEYEEPLWVNFKKIFYARSKKWLVVAQNKMREFSRRHPHLRLIETAEAVKKNIVYDGDALFREGNTLYRKMKYTYNSYTFTNY